MRKRIERRNAWKASSSEATAELKGAALAGACGVDGRALVAVVVDLTDEEDHAGDDRADAEPEQKVRGDGGAPHAGLFFAEVDARRAEVLRADPFDVVDAPTSDQPRDAAPEERGEPGAADDERCG